MDYLPIDRIFSTTLPEDEMLAAMDACFDMTARELAGIPKSAPEWREALAEWCNALSAADFHNASHSLAQQFA